MVNTVEFLELVVLAVGLIGIGAAVTVSPRRVKAGIIAAAFFVGMMGVVAQPSLAEAVNEDVLTQEQKELNETLKITPQGHQYQGLEYVEPGTAEKLSDRQIERKILSEIPSNLKLSVSNGAVRVSGKVSDIQTARQVVQDIKAIPGVHEVAYDLGLTENPNT